MAKTLDPAIVAAHLGVRNADAAVTQAATVAADLVNQEARACVNLPDSIWQRAALEVAAELYNRRTAPNGVKSFGDMDGSVIRIARDAMVAARPFLKPWKGRGFA